jgi:rhamnosyltransferase
MKVSVIIRTHNEEKTVGKLFDSLKTQTFKDFEIILVDNSSNDNTVEIAKEYKIDKYINIPEGKFSHPKSLNDAIEKASGDLIVITNGHAVPYRDDWLEVGINCFKDPIVAGISGFHVAGDDEIPESFNYKFNNLSNVNSIIRTDLWDKYHFDENLDGCEDYDWGVEMESRGYKILKVADFSLRHYHPTIKTRREYWKKMVEVIDKKKRPTL